jgi:hypothetical protein
VFLLNIFIEKKAVSAHLHINFIEKNAKLTTFFIFYMKKLAIFFAFLWKSAESALFLIILLKKRQISFFFHFL